MNKYSKPVNKDEFWEIRLNAGVKLGRLHIAVYDTDPDDWERIGKAHQKLLSEYGVEGQVLDAGCGYGRLSEWIQGDYVGVDLSFAFIEKARELYPNKTFFKRDLKKLEFDDKVFNWAVCISMKRMIIDNLGWEEWGKIEEELRRVSKNILILEYSSPFDHEVIRTI
jgi:SAM-dependent methyltransferase|tara:strand:- start:10788 stop:11288 length:501 start_codon:yes stop_codon:yes gene_type:complete